MNNNQPATLWDYYSSRGQALPSVAERRQQFGLPGDYTGTSQQNTELLRRLLGGPTMPAATPTTRGNGVVIAGPAQPNKMLISGQVTGMRSPMTDGFVEGTPEQYKALIEQAAQKYGVSTVLLSALLKQESGFNPQAVSPAGAQGIAQFMPGTARAYGIDPLSPDQAIPGAARYLGENYEKFQDWDKALAAYNAGPGNVSKYGGIPPFKETQNYVKRIKDMMTQPEVMQSQKL